MPTLLRGFLEALVMTEVLYFIYLLLDNPKSYIKHCYLYNNIAYSNKNKKNRTADVYDYV